MLILYNSDQIGKMPKIRYTTIIWKYGWFMQNNLLFLRNNHYFIVNISGLAAQKLPESKFTYFHKVLLRLKIKNAFS